MSTKVGRNERCPCGSGKKAKNCCAAQTKAPPVGRRKLTARVLSAGGVYAEQQKQQQEAVQSNVDYMGLMERSFGKTVQEKESSPPIPEAGASYLVDQ